MSNANVSVEQQKNRQVVNRMTMRMISWDMEIRFLCDTSRRLRKKMRMRRMRKSMNEKVKKCRLSSPSHCKLLSSSWKYETDNIIPTCDVHLNLYVTNWLSLQTFYVTSFHELWNIIHFISFHFSSVCFVKYSIFRGKHFYDTPQQMYSACRLLLILRLYDTLM